MLGGATLGSSADSLAGEGVKCGTIAGVMNLVLTGDSVTFGNSGCVSGGSSLGAASHVGVVVGPLVDAFLSSVLILLLVDGRGNVKSPTSLSSVSNLSWVAFNSSVRVR